MKKCNSLAVLILSLLIACGGGGGNDTDPLPPQTANPVVATSNTEEPVKTADLVAPAEFKFTTARTVEVRIKTPSLTGKRGFVSIYSEYRTNANQQLIPLYDSRLLMKPVVEDGVDATVMVTNDVDEVLVQVVSDTVSDGIGISVLPIESENLVTWNY